MLPLDPVIGPYQSQKMKLANLFPRKIPKTREKTTLTVLLNPFETFTF